MVRTKVDLKFLENEFDRRNHFLRVKPWMSEKILEISNLTGAHVLYIVFSPSGEPCIYLGKDTEFGEMIRRFAGVPVDERENRRFNNFATLKIRLKKKNNGDDIDIPEIANAWKRKRMDDLNENLRNHKAKLSEVNNKSSFLAYPKNIKNIGKIEEMEERLRKSIDGLRKRKGHLKSLAREMQNEDAADQQILEQVLQSPHHGTIHQGINENSQQLMFHGNVESFGMPTMNAQNVESGPGHNYAVPSQHSNFDLGSSDNFGFTSDLGSYGSDFDFMQFEDQDPSSFISMFQSDEAGPSNGAASSSQNFGGF